MTIHATEIATKVTKHWLHNAPLFFAQPIKILRDYKPAYLRPDLIASLTLAVVMLPQAIAYALIVDLPAEIGLYAAIVSSIVGALWGSSYHLHTGPTNTTSLLVLGGMVGVAVPGTPLYLKAAALMAIVAGLIRLVMGLARLGVLVNFVSDSVIVGFTAGAGALIIANQIRNILRLSFDSTPYFFDTMYQIGIHISEFHLPSLTIGLLVIAVLLFLRWIRPNWPAAFIAMAAASILVWAFRLDDLGVSVLGSLPRSLPPVTSLSFKDLQLVTRMAPSILAVALIGLIEAASISRAIATRSGQYLDSDQEFVGQGMANIIAGVFSGYPVAGSLTRSAVNYEAGAKTQMAAVFSGIWVLLATLLFAPIAAVLPKAALAGLLVVTGVKMFDFSSMQRIWKTSSGDSAIMLTTLIATLLLPLEFAVLAGILISFARFIAKTSTPGVYSMLPDEEFQHFEYRPEKPECPQLGVITINGSLYFGATHHVEDQIRAHMDAHPGQKYLLLRMHRVNHCDISGIHMLETIARLYRQKGGDIFMVGVHRGVWEKMSLSDFDIFLGEDHFLKQEDAIAYIFYKILDPTVCVYKCQVRAWKECQSLPKSERLRDVAFHDYGPALKGEPTVTPQELWLQLNNRNGGPPVRIIDVREPLEYEQGHLRQAELIPMSELLREDHPLELPRDDKIIFVCRSGRRSGQVVHALMQKGYTNVANLQGGMMALELAVLPDVGR